jgi:hypothetical protein
VEAEAEEVPVHVPEAEAQSDGATDGDGAGDLTEPVADYVEEEADPAPGPRKRTRRPRE